MIAYISLDHLYMFDEVLINEISDETVTRELTKINLPFNETHLIISVVGESYVNVLANTVDKIISYDFNKVTLIINSNIRKTYPQLLSSNILEKCEIVPINFWLLYCIKDLERRNIRRSSWNWYNEKGCFPTGCLARDNRIGFLKQLYNSNLLDNIISLKLLEGFRRILSSSLIIVVKIDSLIPRILRVFLISSMDSIIPRYSSLDIILYQILQYCLKLMMVR